LVARFAKSRAGWRAERPQLVLEVDDLAGRPLRLFTLAFAWS